MAFEDQTLEALLDQSIEGGNEVRQAFYTALLNTDVIIPLKPRKTSETEGEVHVAGADPEESMGFYLFTFEGRSFVPCFSKQEYLDAWLDEVSLPHTTKNFKTLLNVLGAERWVYLNPNQECGKEFSPWELACLRSGEDAIPEILSELEQIPSIEIEVQPIFDDSYADFTTAAISIIDAYPEIEEAFMVEVRYSDTEPFRPLLGLHINGLSAEKTARVVDEISVMAENSLEGERVAVVSDLHNKQSPNHAIFHDVKPFYFSLRPPKDRLKPLRNLADSVRRIATQWQSPPDDESHDLRTETQREQDQQLVDELAQDANFCSQTSSTESNTIESDDEADVESNNAQQSENKPR